MDTDFYYAFDMEEAMDLSGGSDGEYEDSQTVISVALNDSETSPIKPTGKRLLVYKIAKNSLVKYHSWFF